MANAPQSESPESLTDLETSPEDERSLGETFTECEAVVEACLRDQLAAGEDKNVS
jgi:hypothetical protein